MAVDGPVAFVLDRFNSMLAADGARLEVVAVDATALTLRYVAGPEGACDACVLDPDDLDVLVADALARQGAALTAVTVLRPDPSVGATTIPGVAERAAHDHAERDALADFAGGGAVSYPALWHLARVGAAVLVDRGVGPGDRVALHADGSPAWAIANLAILCTGAAVVPVSTRWRAAEVDDVLGRAGCRVVLDAADVDALTSTRPSSDGTAEVGRRLAALTPDAVSHVQLTSGTTGRPKGALLTHRGMVTTTAAWVDVVGLRPGDRYPVVNPCSHIGGHKTGLLACLVAGATAAPVARFDAEALRRAIGRGEATFLQGPPAMFAALLDRIDASGEPAPRGVRVAVTGSATIPAELVVRVRETLGVDAVHAGYGLTEATGVCTITRADDPLDVVVRTSGRPIPGVEVRIAEPAEGDEGGEILVRGPGVMRGYLDDPAATAEAVDADGWLHTGDVGAFDADGNLRILDRLTDVVIVNGFNVYPAEVERVLREHPAVRDAAVVGIPDPARGEAPVAFAVTGEDAGGPGADPPTATDLIAHLRERLASYKVPVAVHLVDALPLTPVPKVDKPALRARARELSGR